MKILIATPLYPPDIGGPAKYAKALHEEYARTGHGGAVVAYGALEKALPPLVRHIVYFFRLLPQALRADAILALDTWSVGIPALYVALLLRKRFLVRIGGDVLWESYLERTNDLVKYSQFYRTPRQLSFKERLMLWGNKRLASRADALVFTTRYQQDIWQNAFTFPPARASIVENFYPGTRPNSNPMPDRKIFVSAGRNMKLKNTPRLLEAFARVKKDHPDIELDTESLPPEANAARLRRCYAVTASSISDMNPNLVIEAIAEGKPFIAPQESGASERLQGLGSFVDTADTHALEGAIREMLKPDVYTQYANSVSSFSFSHSWGDIAEEYLAIAKRI